MPKANTPEGTTLICELTKEGRLSDKNYVIERCTEIVLQSSTTTESIAAAATTPTTFDESHPNVAALALAMQTALSAVGIGKEYGKARGKPKYKAQGCFTSATLPEGQNARCAPRGHATSIMMKLPLNNHATATTGLRAPCHKGTTSRTEARKWSD